MRRALTVTPARCRTGSHFIEDDGCGIAFGGRVPTVAKLEERFEIWRCADADILQRRAGKREVKNFQVQLLAVLFNADVVGLEVAMGNALFFQILDDLKEILAKAPEEFE